MIGRGATIDGFAAALAMSAKQVTVLTNSLQVLMNPWGHRDAVRVIMTRATILTPRPLTGTANMRLFTRGIMSMPALLARRPWDENRRHRKQNCQGLCRGETAHMLAQSGPGNILNAWQ